MQQNLDVTRSQFRQPEFAPLSEVRMIPNKVEAIRRCVTKWKGTQKDLAELLDMTEGHLSRCLSAKSKAHFPPNKEHRLQIICGSWIVLQFSSYQAGFDLVEHRKTASEIKDDRIAELEQQLARIA